MAFYKKRALSSPKAAGHGDDDQQKWAAGEAVQHLFLNKKIQLQHGDHSTPAAILTQYKKSIADLRYLSSTDLCPEENNKKSLRNSATTVAAGNSPFLSLIPLDPILPSLSFICHTKGEE